MNDNATEALWKRATTILASGTWSVSHGAYTYPDGVFPLMAKGGKGCRIVDTNDQVYIDWLMAWGTTILGYRDAAVEDAVIRQLQSCGSLFSLLHPIEVETAELLREIVPSAEGVAFAKNGSDGLGAAARLARATTGRDLILVCGYHGFHDWYVASLPWVDGLPDVAREWVKPFRYNDEKQLSDLFEEHRGQIAAVFMEPVKEELPHVGYLEFVRNLTLDHGALLVFDEVITAFRVSRGGAQEFFELTPDLSCLGKAMGNGFAISALCGKRDLMEELPRIGYGSTFRGETTSLAAARATLEQILIQPINDHVARVGDQLRRGFEAACSRFGVTAGLHGHSSRMTMKIMATGSLSSIELETLFIQECLRNGVFTNGLFLPSAAHDDEAVSFTIATFHVAVERVAQAIAHDSTSSLLYMHGANFFDPRIKTKEKRA